jgi:predicted nucleic acid-binding protein
MSVQGRADYVVTGDREVLALGTFRGVRMLSVRDFVELRQP